MVQETRPTPSRQLRGTALGDDVRDRGDKAILRLFTLIDKVLILFLIPLALTACAHHDFYVNEVELQQKWLPFLEDGKITKEEVKSKLAEPVGEYEDGRIWTYRKALSEEQADKMGVSGSYKGNYSLVLVFDEKNILKKHSLVRYRNW